MNEQLHDKKGLGNLGLALALVVLSLVVISPTVVNYVRGPSGVGMMSFISLLLAAVSIWQASVTWRHGRIMWQALSAPVILLGVIVVYSDLVLILTVISIVLVKYGYVRAPR